MIHIAITGDPLELEDRLPPTTAKGAPLKWQVLSVIQFEPVAVQDKVLELATVPAPDWIVWMSPRGVLFWNALCLEKQYEVPAEVKVACMGSRTRSIAEREGWDVDFCPRLSGSEAFLAEFIPVITRPNRVLIPGAEGGRSLVARSLQAAGHAVSSLPIYRTFGISNVAVETPPELLVITSPSSFDSLNADQPELVKSTPLAAIGDFTASRMRELGFTGVKVVPDGDLDRVGELL